MNAWRAFAAMFAKDLRIEARTRTLYLASLSFGLLLTLMLGFALDGAGGLPVDWTSGTLWLIVFVSGMLTFNRQDDKERWDEAFAGALSAPVDRSVVFYARLAANLLFVWAVELLSLPLFFLVFHLEAPPHAGSFFSAMALGTLAFTSVGTFLAVVASASSLREILLPVLLLPLSVPLFLGLITLTKDALLPGTPAQPDTAWWAVTGGYAVLFTGLPGLLFELIAEV